MTALFIGRYARRAVRIAIGIVALLAVASRSPAQTRPVPGGMNGEMEWSPTLFLMLDELEYVPGAQGRPIAADMTGFYGGAFNRLWFRGEGELLTEERAGQGELEVLYGRLIDPFFDAVVGVRVDRAWGEDESATRALLSVGLQGLAPGWFEIAPSLFISQDGDVSGRLKASYDAYLNQRLVVEPDLEMNFAVQEVPQFGVGSGLNDFTLGARMRYEISRKFAPYLGASWSQRIADTAELTRAAGEEVRDFSVVVGVRVWR